MRAERSAWTYGIIGRIVIADQNRRDTPQRSPSQGNRAARIAQPAPPHPLASTPANHSTPSTKRGPGRPK
ncbi:hypothetical protein LBMAG42_45550 [Deltaproteobacteria bacterium]|nr:hypothetical protein LBMAG42_45550 [Deltaproteobacteria bacterium]